MVRAGFALVLVLAVLLVALLPASVKRIQPAPVALTPAQTAAVLGAKTL